MDELILKLEESLNNWNALKEYGGRDPLWADGANMNLVRNHISYFKKQIKELCDKQGLALPEVYKRETPIEVDSNYMANAEEIKAKAIQSLEMYKNDTSFNELESVAHTILDKKVKQVAVNILGYRRALEVAIKEDDLVTMRRHLNYESYLKSAEEFVKGIKEKDFEGQLTLFG